MPPAKTLTEPTSAVPLTCGVLSPTVLPPTGDEISGAEGGCAFTIKDRKALLGPVLLELSVAAALTLTAPSPRLTTLVQLQLPDASLLPLQSVVVPLKTTTETLSSAVPLNWGVLEFTTAPSAGLVIAGATGALASIRTVILVLGVLLLSAASVAIAVKE